MFSFSLIMHQVNHMKNKPLTMQEHDVTKQKGVQKWFGQGLLFHKIRSCKIMQIITGKCSLSTAFHNQMALVKNDCEKLLCHYQV
jgi:hypothetical protein